MWRYTLRVCMYALCGVLWPPRGLCCRCYLGAPARGSCSFLSLPVSHCLSLTASQSLSLSLAVSHSLSLTVSRCLSLTVSHCLTLSLAVSCCLSRSLTATPTQGAVHPALCVRGPRHRKGPRGLSRRERPGLVRDMTNPSDPSIPTPRWCTLPDGAGWCG